MSDKPNDEQDDWKAIFHELRPYLVAVFIGHETGIAIGAAALIFMLWLKTELRMNKQTANPSTDERIE